MKRFVIALVSFFSLITLADAQTSTIRSVLETQNNTTITTNHVGGITGAILNSMLGNIIASEVTQSDVTNILNGDGFLFANGPSAPVVYLPTIPPSSLTPITPGVLGFLGSGTGPPVSIPVTGTGPDVVLSTAPTITSEIFAGTPTGLNALSGGPNFQSAYTGTILNNVNSADWFTANFNYGSDNFFTQMYHLFNQVGGTFDSNVTVSTTIPVEIFAGNVTITIASPAVFNPNPSLPVGAPVILSTTGTLPTGLIAGATYYVSSSGYNLTGNFELTTTVGGGGSPINTTGTQSGIQTVNAIPAAHQIAGFQSTLTNYSTNSVTSNAIAILGQTIAAGSNQYNPAFNSVGADARRLGVMTASSVSGTTLTLGGSIFGACSAGNMVLETSGFGVIPPGTTITGTSPNFTMSNSAVVPRSSLGVYCVDGGLSGNIVGDEMDVFAYNPDTNGRFLLDYYISQNTGIQAALISMFNQSSLGDGTTAASTTSATIVGTTGSGTLTIVGPVTGVFQVGQYLVDNAGLLPQRTQIISQTSPTVFIIAPPSGGTMIPTISVGAPLSALGGSPITLLDGWTTANGTVTNALRVGTTAYGNQGPVGTPSQNIELDYIENAVAKTLRVGLINLTPAYSGNTQADLLLQAGAFTGVLSYDVAYGGFYNSLSQNAASASIWTPNVNYSANAYSYWLGNLYQTSAGGIAGGTAPTWTTGTQSDGTVSWTYIGPTDINLIQANGANNVEVGPNANEVIFNSQILVGTNSFIGSLSSGQGAINAISTLGVEIRGSGSTCDVTLLNHAGAQSACVLDSSGAPFQITPTTDSTSTTTGALQVSGGVGIAKSLVVGTAASAEYFISTGTVPTGTTGSCHATAFAGGSTAGTFTAPSCGAGTIILSGLPGTNNGYTCGAQDQTTPADTLKQTANTATSVTFLATTAASDVIVFHCTGW